MNRIMTGAALATALLMAAPPAYANGQGDDGPVSIGVLGQGLHVREVRAILDGQEAGAKARISLWKKDRHGEWSWARQVRGWKYTTARDLSNYKFEYASWRVNTRFPNRSRLCVEFAGYNDRLACATIHS